MTNFIPIFPLNIVVFPGETLNLHIFEPRYKQMIADCLEQKKSFGLLPVINDSNTELGTLLEITEMAKKYENGEYDIRTRGISVFRILEQVHEIPAKLYQGAIVNYPPNELSHGDTGLATKLTSEVKRLYSLLNVADKFPEGKTAMLSYEIGHYVGFSMAQESEMLGLFTELQRLEYIRRHLNSIVPVIKELEEMKDRIKRNGHFRNLS